MILTLAGIAHSVTCLALTHCEKHISKTDKILLISNLFLLLCSDEAVDRYD